MPGLRDMVMGMIGQRIGPYEDRLSELRRFGPGAQMRTAVDYARGALEGPADPMFSGMDPSELALRDRLAWGQEMQQQVGKLPAALSSLYMGGGYEGAKALAQGDVPLLSSGARMLMGGVGAGLGGANAGHMQMDRTTSPASMRNVMAMLYGALR